MSYECRISSDRHAKHSEESRFSVRCQILRFAQGDGNEARGAKLLLFVI